MPLRFVCSVCNSEVWKQGGNMKLGLCNKCYIRNQRSVSVPCTACGRIMKPYGIHNPICSNCQSLRYAKRYCEEHDKKYDSVFQNDSELRMQQYWWFLAEGLGEKVRPKWEAFFPVEKLLNTGTIGLNWTWDELELFRKEQTVRYKAALYVYMDFLGQKGLVLTRDENRYESLNNKLIKGVSAQYQDAFRAYLGNCLKQRNLNNWTIYMNAHHLNEFFCWLKDYSIEPQLTALSDRHIIEYLLFLRERVSQRTVYIVKTVLDDFFKWSKQKRLVFTSPSAVIDVKCPKQKPIGLPLDEQRRLLKRWLDESCDPQESIIGMLALFYGLSNEEFRLLTVQQIDIDKRKISLETRRAPLAITDEIFKVLIKYLAYRKAQLNGSECKYLFFSSRSARLIQPINHLILVKKLKSANVNLRSLRATLLIDLALTGNVKVLEVLGLSIDGCKPYLNIVKDALSQQNLKSIK